MKFDRQTPPAGNVRDWVDSRANNGGTAFVFPETGETLSWSELQVHAKNIAEDLTAQGIAKGESIVVMHPNGLEGVKALFAVLYGGFRVTMLNLAAGPDALGYAMKHSEARVAFVHDTQLDMFDQVRPDKLNCFVASGQRADLCDIAPSDDALLMYTSGTTGRPKGVVHTQSSLLAGGWTVSVAHELTTQDRGMGVLPFYHINGLCVSVMGSLIPKLTRRKPRYHRKRSTRNQATHNGNAQTIDMVKRQNTYTPILCCQFMRHTDRPTTGKQT